MVAFETSGAQYLRTIMKVPTMNGGTAMYLLTHTKEKHEPWNKGKLVGQKPPLKLKEVWVIRFRLEMANRIRELAQSTWP